MLKLAAPLPVLKLNPAQYAGKIGRFTEAMRGLVKDWHRSATWQNRKLIPQATAADQNLLSLQKQLSMDYANRHKYQAFQQGMIDRLQQRLRAQPNNAQLRDIDAFLRPKLSSSPFKHESLPWTGRAAKPVVLQD